MCILWNIYVYTKYFSKIFCVYRIIFLYGERLECKKYIFKCFPITFIRSISENEMFLRHPGTIFFNLTCIKKSTGISWLLWAIYDQIDPHSPLIEIVYYWSKVSFFLTFYFTILRLFVSDISISSLYFPTILLFFCRPVLRFKSLSKISSFRRLMFSNYSCRVSINFFFSSLGLSVHT